LNITYPQRLAILIKDKIKKFESKINGERVDPNL